MLIKMGSERINTGTGRGLVGQHQPYRRTEKMKCTTCGEMVKEYAKPTEKTPAIRIEVVYITNSENGNTLNTVQVLCQECSDMMNLAFKHLKKERPDEYHKYG